MEVILTHDNADFDALAALVGARKLYPDARMVFSAGGGGADIRAFLALHRDRFPTIGPSDVDGAAVRRVILVDVRRARRLRGYGAVTARLVRKDPTLDVHVYDHHPAAPDDVRGSFEIIAPVGSATTLLVESIRARGLPVDTLEATLLALGIHADTGSLTFAGTTPRDAEALAFLLGRGVALPVLNRYLDPHFSPAQRELIRGMIGAAVIHRVGGVPIAFVEQPLTRGSGGLDAVTSHVAALEDHPVLFALYGARHDRVHVIARARVPWVDVGAVLATLGGGGHRSAGSAIVRDASFAEVRARILAALTRDPPRPAVARDLMSSPVHTVTPDVTLRALSASLVAWHHTGAPVLEGGRLVGIVSRRDVAEAEKHDKLDRTVASRMTREVITITPDTPLEEALGKMETSDVGRLPVIEDGRLLGILTRSDVLRCLYGAGEARRAAP
jgi:tRNA nucleotidyltransferase (CCA-adding enzyme)